MLIDHAKCLTMIIWSLATVPHRASLHKRCSSETLEPSQTTGFHSTNACFAACEALLLIYLTCFVHFNRSKSPVKPSGKTFLRFAFAVVQVRHSSQLLQQVATALSSAQERQKEPVARACAAVEAVVTAHANLQVSFRLLSYFFPACTVIS